MTVELGNSCYILVCVSGIQVCTANTGASGCRTYNVVSIGLLSILTNDTPAKVKRTLDWLTINTYNSVWKKNQVDVIESWTIGLGRYVLIIDIKITTTVGFNYVEIVLLQSKWKIKQQTELLFQYAFNCDRILFHSQTFIACHKTLDGYTNIIKSSLMSKSNPLRCQLAPMRYPDQC